MPKFGAAVFRTLGGVRGHIQTYTYYILVELILLLLLLLLLLLYYYLHVPMKLHSLDETCFRCVVSRR